jgi:hypothetical protein
LEYIIPSKYLAVLKLETDKEGVIHAYGQNCVKEYLQKERWNLAQASHSKSISMTITINDVDQERCGNFLWDLAHKAIRDKFDFNFDLDTSDSVYGNAGSVQANSIAVDEFEAHHTIVKRAFQYLSQSPVPPDRGHRVAYGVLAALSPGLPAPARGQRNRCATADRAV